jgi:hypothetical protein
VSTPAATNHSEPRRPWFPDCKLLFVAGNAKPGTCGERGAKQLILQLSFGAREARLALIDSASRRNRKMRDFDEERVPPLTLCPNSDAAMSVVFAHDAWSSELETLSEALKGVRGEISDEWSAKCTITSKPIETQGTHESNTNPRAPWRRQIEPGITGHQVLVRTQHAGLPG